MIIVRSPLRISIGGGGTDIPSYFKRKKKVFLYLRQLINMFYVTVTNLLSKAFILNIQQIEKINQNQFY